MFKLQIMKKMNKTLSLLTVLLLLFVAACTRELPGEADGATGLAPEEDIHYERLAVASDTKVSFNETTGSFAWQGSESIRVQRSVSNAVDVSVDVSGAEAEVEIPLVGSETRTGFAYYPANILADASAAARCYNISLPYTYDDYVYPYAPTPMIAIQADSDGLLLGNRLEFQHLGGVLLLTLTVDDGVGDDLQTLVVRTDKRIWGDFTATASGGHLSIATDSDATLKTREVAYKLSSPVSPGVTCKLMVPLPVGTYTVEKVLGYTATGKLIASTTSASSSQTIGRKKGKKVAMTLYDFTILAGWNFYGEGYTNATKSSAQGSALGSTWVDGDVHQTPPTYGSSASAILQAVAAGGAKPAKDIVVHGETRTTAYNLNPSYQFRGFREDDYWLATIPAVIPDDSMITVEAAVGGAKSQPGFYLLQWSTNGDDWTTVPGAPSITLSSGGISDTFNAHFWVATVDSDLRVKYHKYMTDINSTYSYSWRKYRFAVSGVTTNLYLRLQVTTGYGAGAITNKTRYNANPPGWVDLKGLEVYLDN